jgi:hypothetical protein
MGLYLVVHARCTEVSDENVIPGKSENFGHADVGRPGHGPGHQVDMDLDIRTPLKFLKKF